MNPESLVLSGVGVFSWLLAPGSSLAIVLCRPAACNGSGSWGV